MSSLSSLARFIFALILPNLLVFLAFTKAWNILENYKINYLNAKLATIVFYNFQLFHDRGPYLIETSPNQSTGFYMIGNSVMKELKNPPIKLNQVLRD